MKLLSLFATCALLGLNSCALSTDKVEEKKDTEGGPVIPPPNSLQASNTGSQAQPQAALPELPTTSEQSSKPRGKSNVTEIDGFVYEDVLNRLPSQRDLATPPAPFIPSAADDESSLSPEVASKPLVSNP